jgi:hypothetical protein
LLIPDSNNKQHRTLLLAAPAVTVKENQVAAEETPATIMNSLQNTT